MTTTLRFCPGRLQARAVAAASRKLNANSLAVSAGDAAPQPGPLANFAALGSGEVAARAAAFVATALLARRLGVDAFGYLGFATAIVSYFGIAITLGLGDIGAREVALRPGSARQLAADAIIVRLLLAVIGIVAASTVAVTAISFPILRSVVLLTSLTLIASALDTAWVFRGLSRNRYAAIVSVLAQLLYLAGIVALIRTPRDVLRVPLIQVAADTLGAFTLLALLFGRHVCRPSVAGGMSLLKQSGFITAARLLRAIIVSFDVLLLGFMTNSHQVGLYTSAYRVCMLVAAIAVATHVVFLPQMAEGAGEGSASLASVLSQSVSLTVAVILPVVVGGIVLARPLLSFLFGPAYIGGTIALQLLLASIGVLSLHGTTHNVFVVMKETRKETAIFAVGAVINIILNLALIPRYQLAGAAFSTLAAEAAILLCIGVALYSSRIRPNLSHVILPIIASTTMAVVLLAMAPRFAVWEEVAIGGVVYVVIFWTCDSIRKAFSL